MPPDQPVSTPRIDPERLWRDLSELGRIGRTPDGGICRPALSAADMQARAWLAGRMAAAGLTVCEDAAGNQIGRLAGKRPEPMLAVGSHLDTVPGGGAFDGALGVLAALECARVIHQAGVRLPVDLAVINFCDEEGAHFAGTLGSRAMVGRLNRDEIHHARGPGLASWAEDAKRRGKDPGRIGEAAVPPERFAAFVELHIEQGPRLEDADRAIGAVTGLVGIRRWQVVVRGRADHAGTCPMDRRCDALVRAAPLFTRLPEWVRACGPEVVGTIGQLAIEPGAPNVVPGTCRFVVEARALEAAHLDRLEHQLAAYAKARAGWQVRAVYAKPAVRLPAAMVSRVAAAARREGLASLAMVSGAGHDAQSFAMAGVPTAMIFVPCRQGRSHCSEEALTSPQAAAGCQVLLGMLLDLAADL